MKGFPKKTHTFIIGIIIFSLLFIASCDNDSDEPVVILSWTLTGIAAIQGTPPDNIMRLAAFYTPSDDSFSSNSTKVSNTVDISQNTNINGEFTLNINAEGLMTNDGDRIELIIWRDDDNGTANNNYETGETYQFLGADTGCLIFIKAIKCCFFYVLRSNSILNLEYGWNVDEGELNTTNIDDTLYTDARIITWSTW